MGQHHRPADKAILGLAPGMVVAAEILIAQEIHHLGEDGCRLGHRVDKQSLIVHRSTSSQAVGRSTTDVGQWSDGDSTAGFQKPWKPLLVTIQFGQIMLPGVVTRGIAEAGLLKAFWYHSDTATRGWFSL